MKIKDLPSQYKEMAIANTKYEQPSFTKEEILDLPLIMAFTFTTSKHPQESEEGIYFWVHVLNNKYPDFVDPKFQETPNKWVKEVTNFLVCEGITWDSIDLRDKLK